MNFFILSLVIYCVVATPISTENNNNRIIAGFDAYAGQFPYQASIRALEYPTETYCSGSIISNQWILTSAQCSMLTTTNNMRIVVGSIYINSGGTTYTVLISLNHPNFDGATLANNIGLIRTNGQIGFTDFVRSIELTNDAISVGLPLTISGWGIIRFPQVIQQNTLQYATFKSISLEECKKRIPVQLFPLFDTQLCTDTGNGQALCGEDGNPIVYKGQQHAVSSFPFCGLYSFADVHTRVAPFRSWIKEITNV